MTLITNKATLYAAIADHLNRDDLTEVIPRFVQLFEGRLRRVLRWKFPVPLQAALIDGNSEPTNGAVFGGVGVGHVNTYFPLASVTDIVSANVIAIDTGVYYPIELVTFPEIMRLRELTPMSGRPTKFAIHESGVQVWPDPPAEGTHYTVYLVVDGALNATPLDAQSDFLTTFNPLLVPYPDVFLYGALTEAAPYLKNDERLPIWKGRVDEALRELEIARDRMQFGGKPPKMKLPRVFG